MDRVPAKITTIVGLPDNAVKESLERMESAIKANGYHFPRNKSRCKSCTGRYQKKRNCF